MASTWMTATIAAAAVAAISTARAEPTLTMLTGATDGVYFPLGMAIGKVLSDNMPEATVQVQATQGSVANLLLLAQHRGEIGFATGDSLIAARDGDVAAGFSSRVTRLRGIGALYPNVIQIIASARSGIRTLSDLKGKRLSLGAPQSGSELNARAILDAAGLDDGDIGKLERLSFAESVARIKDGSLDATLQSAGLGAASLNELSNTTSIVMVAVPRELVERMGPPFAPATIPANTYRGQNSDVPAAAVMNYLVTRADLSDDLAYRMAALVFGRLPDLAKAHPAARDITLDSAARPGPVPLHPGALRYFAEAYNARGEARLTAGERPGALADFAIAMRIDPQHRTARANHKALAQALEREGALTAVKPNAAGTASPVVKPSHAVQQPDTRPPR